MIEKKTLITALSVFAFALFTVFLFLIQKSDWNNDLKAAEEVRDSLSNVVSHYQDSISSMVEEQRANDSLKALKIYENHFDLYDSKNFRIYALYKDTENRYSSGEIARKFNVTSTSAVKSSTVNGDSWYVVPVKGTHYVQKGETLLGISRMYYFNAEADMKLIKEFNKLKELQAGQMLVIPFN